MNQMWVSAQECESKEIVWLTELLRKDPQLQVVLSYAAPGVMERQNVTETRLSGILTRLGVKPNLKGYQYLKTSVLVGMRDREELEGVTKRLYPSVGKKHGVSGAKVEHAIRHAIEVAWTCRARNSVKEQERIFGYHGGEGKRPTNSEFILGLIAYMECNGGPLYS